MIVDAALAGLGIGYVLDDRAKEHFKPGTLVRLLADCCPFFAGSHWCCPGRRQLSPALGAFIEAIRVRPAGKARR